MKRPILCFALLGAALLSYSPALADPPVDKTANAKIVPGDWPMWGGTPYRNNTPIAKNIPTEWNIGSFDRKTGKWIPEKAENIKWVAPVGSQTYGNVIVGSGKVFVGTNNGSAYVKRYPSEIDLGCFVCFRESDGKFLWQDSNEKLPTGRVHDWPQQGVCAAGYVEGDRVWYVSNRGEVVCLDVEGFHDNEDDGPVQNQWGTLLDLPNTNEQFAGVVDALKGGKLSPELRNLLAERGMPLPEAVQLKEEQPGRQWHVTATVEGAERQIRLMLQGPKLHAEKLITVDDKEEADTLWRYNMMTQLGVSQHNMASCSVTALGDILFVNTSNGVDESHLNIPAPDAPSFIAMDKNTGEVYWTDSSPGLNIHHGQWSSPTVARIGGVDQVLFGGGDGWLYSFKADKGQDGKPELLWKFDCNPKTAKLILGGRGTRNDIIGTPVVYDGLVYVAVGQDPEHGEGIGHLWCIDPTKRGDVSAELAVHVSDRTKPIPHKRVQAVVEENGEVAVPNPNSAVVWHYSEYDADGDGEIAFEETMHRSCGTVAIQDDVLFIADFSGLFHCLDAKTGKPYWTYDMLAAAWGSPLIVDDKVYIGDEDGDIAIFEVTKEPHEPIVETNMGNSVYTTPIVANGVLYISNRTHIFAIQSAPEAAE